MNPACIDLKERFGDRYRVQYEESYYAEYGPNAYTRDPWYMVIPCRSGHIYPHGDDLLAVATKSRGSVAKRLLAVPGVELLQDGSDGINASFPVDAFDRVAEIVKPRRRRRLSPEQKARLVAAGAPYRKLPGAQRPESERTAVGAGTPDTLPVHRPAWLRTRH